MYDYLAENRIDIVTLLQSCVDAKVTVYLCSPPNYTKDFVLFRA